MQLTPSPVKLVAQENNLPLLQPATLKTPEIQRQLAEYGADVMVVAAYGLILPKSVLEMPHYGCLNIHASLLPRWRGAAPVQRAILAGDRETGVTIMQMDEGLDTGAMLLKKTCPIEARDTANTLLEKLTLIGADAILEVLERLDEGTMNPEEQDSSQATYASKLTKAEAALNWKESSEQLQRAVQAYNPFPAANGTLNQTPIKIWQATARPGNHGEPGQVLAVDQNGILVACGSGALNLEVLQRPNSKALSAAQFVHGFPVKPGDRFEAK